MEEKLAYIFIIKDIISLFCSVFYNLQIEEGIHVSNKEQQK